MGARILFGSTNTRAQRAFVYFPTKYIANTESNSATNTLYTSSGWFCMRVIPGCMPCIIRAPEITAICGGLNINIGTLNKRTIPAMYAAGRKANELGHRVLLDPVGSGASRLRTETARGLIREIRFDVIRGNISEIKALAVGTETTKGVDADVADAVTEDNLSEAVEFVKSFARREGCVAAVTGAIDLVSDGQRCFVIRNGRPEMGRITGTGCQLSAVMTAFITANRREEVLESAAAAVCAMGLAGEIGFFRLSPGEGNATYRNRIIDALYHMDGDQLEKGARYEIR